jgi:voltage-gated sodium channel
LIVCVSIFELLPFPGIAGLMILRLFRMLRIFKAARALPRLRAIIAALGGGLSSSCWVVVLMAILNYILACIGMMEFKANDPFHFGTLMSAIFSVWRIETGDSWDQILRINMYGCATFPLGYPMVGDLPKGELDERDIKIAGEDPDLQCTDEVAMGYYAALYIIFTVIFGGLVLQSVLIGIIAISFEVSVARFDGRRLTDID